MSRLSKRLRHHYDVKRSMRYCRRYWEGVRASFLNKKITVDVRMEPSEEIKFLHLELGKALRVPIHHLVSL